MSAEDFEGIRMLARQNHAERVAKTPERIEYAEKRFKDENIAYKILNKSIGHFHVFDEFGNLFQFWASTGKITYAKNTKDARGFKSFTDERGIENCIKIVKYRNLKRQAPKARENEFVQEIAELKKQLLKEKNDNAELVSLIDAMRNEDPKIAELENEIERLNANWNSLCNYLGEQIAQHGDDDIFGYLDDALKVANQLRKYDANRDIEKVEFAIAELIKFKERLIKFLQDEGFYENEWYDLFDEIDQQIDKLRCKNERNN